jgi:hypothetical protein
MGRLKFLNSFVTRNTLLYKDDDDPEYDYFGKMAGFVSVENIDEYESDTDIISNTVDKSLDLHIDGQDCNNRLHKCGKVES